MSVVCFSTEPGIHIGTGVMFPSGAELCLGGPVDADRYNTGTKMFCAVTYPPGVSGPNIKTYFGGELKKTYYGDPGRSGQFVWWTSGGWTGVVRFDFCDGADVLCSRSTVWTVDVVLPVHDVVPEVPPVHDVVPEVPPVHDVVPEAPPEAPPVPGRATVVRISGLPESAKAGERMIANVVVKNVTDEVTLMFSVRLTNADTGLQYGGFNYTPYINPGEEAAVNIRLAMPAGTDPLNLVAEVCRGNVLHDSMEASVARKIPEPEPEVGEQCYIKFDIPLLDQLPGIPCEWWGELPLLPGFKKTTEP
ncbi:MAG: hypothetical protein U9R15_00575 [Chloroflexota bacterium]|nr:hypothetical protein [Chloroflexota bacterium]